MATALLVFCLLTLPLAASAERVTIGPWQERPWTVSLERDPDVDCTLEPEQVLNRVEGHLIQCTSFDRTPGRHGSGDRRPVWFVHSHGGGSCPDGRNTGTWTILDDATGREVNRGTYPCGAPPKRPEGPPAYKVTVDPGVGCRMLPDEVAEKFGWWGITSMRCTTADKLWQTWGPEGRDRSVVWVVERRDGGWSAIDDATGETRAGGGLGAARRGLDTDPVAPQP
jgi:hypothetical protein